MIFSLPHHTAAASVQKGGVSCQPDKVLFPSPRASSAGQGRAGSTEQERVWGWQSRSGGGRAMAPSQPSDKGQIRGSLAHGSEAAPVQAAESLCHCLS